jgi:hypothetical protein
VRTTTVKIAVTVTVEMIVNQMSLTLLTLLRKGVPINMCSIAGYISNKEHSRDAQNKFSNILIQAEVRGTDACGIAFIASKNRYFYAKAPKKASEFIQEKIYRDLIGEHDPSILIGHNRQKTQGDEKNNMNNHPIVTKNGLALIHNGIIHNDDELFKKYELHRDGEVDSEIIVRLIEHFIYADGKTTQEAIQLAFKEIRGSMAIALLNYKEPKTIYVVTRTNPLNLAYHIPTGTIFFASTEDILKDGLIAYDTYFKSLFWKARSKDEYVFKRLSDDTGFKITQRSWKGFEVETPSVTTTPAITLPRTATPRSRGSRYFISGRPIDIELGEDGDIEKVLRGIDDFDVFDRIRRPSRYLSDLLIYRLEYIQELFVSGDYQYQDSDEDGYELKRLREEVQRIIHTLEERKKTTKKVDIFVPSLEDIWLLNNKKFSKELEKDGAIKKGFSNLEWILTHKNPEARERLDKAGILTGKGADADEEFDLPEDDEEAFREKDVPCEYYCHACKRILPTNLCQECGTINLDSIEDLYGKEMQKDIKERNRDLLN